MGYYDGERVVDNETLPDAEQLKGLPTWLNHRPILACDYQELNKTVVDRDYDDAKFISVVESVTPSLLHMGKESASDIGSGGMYTKLKAAQIACKSGADMIIASGADMSVIGKIIDGEEIGTLFEASRIADFDFDDYLMNEREGADERKVDLNGLTHPLKLQRTGADARDDAQAAERVAAREVDDRDIGVQLEDAFHDGVEIGLILQEIGGKVIDPPAPEGGPQLRVLGKAGKIVHGVAGDRAPGTVSGKFFLEGLARVLTDDGTVLRDLIDERDGAVPGVVDTEVDRNEVGIGHSSADLGSLSVEDCRRIFVIREVFKLVDLPFARIIVIRQAVTEDGRGKARVPAGEVCAALGFGGTDCSRDKSAVRALDLRVIGEDLTAAVVVRQTKAGSHTVTEENIIGILFDIGTVSCQRTDRQGRDHDRDQAEHSNDLFRCLSHCFISICRF